MERFSYYFKQEGKLKNIMIMFWFFSLRRKIYRKKIPEGSTYTKMLLVGRTGGEIYFAYCFFIFGQLTWFAFVIRHELIKFISKAQCILTHLYINFWTTLTKTLPSCSHNYSYIQVFLNMFNVSGTMVKINAQHHTFSRSLSAH